VHPFPARMAPGIALQAVPRSKKQLRVLDPMMGSGTVLAVARSKGHSAIGVDLDPLATLIASVWTTAVDPRIVRDRAALVLSRAKRTHTTLRQRDAYPQHADRETRSFVAYWFDPYARRQLASLATSIARVRDQKVRDALWCAFSRMVITKQAGVSLARDLSHSRPHRAFDRSPVKPFRKFLAAVDRVSENCIDGHTRHRGPRTRIISADARKLPLPDSSVDLVVTSPPYLNAIDYMRCSKFSLVWMGHSVKDLRKLRSEAIGANVSATSTEEYDSVLRQLRLSPPLDERERAVLVRYIRDMRRAMREIARVLSPRGKAICVVGENTIRCTYVRNAVILCILARICGLKLVQRHTRLLPANRRYLPPPARGSRAPLDRRIRREVILKFRKGSTITACPQKTLPTSQSGFEL
jgi:DNA modification methylase